jgi:gamma-glutamyltranspeptidase
VSGAIATPHAAATRAALLAFERGGSAVDAALAAAAALCVVYPHQTSIGGDLWALVARPGEPVVCVNGSGAAPAGVDVEALRREHAEIPDSGPVPVTVPGALAAWETLARLGGRLGLAAAVAPAVELASDGIEVSRSLAAGIRSRLPQVAADPGLRAVFTDDGRPLDEGEVVRQPALARSLAQIADAGCAAFYRGSIGAAFVAGLNRLGSPLSLDDLASHETLLPAPLESVHGSVRLVTAPPNSQGFVLLELVAALGLDAADPLDAVEAALLGAADRDAYLGDPATSRPPLELLLDPERARARLSRPATAPAAVVAGGDTVAVTAIDDDGCAVSLIQSVFQTFGASILEAETGIVCHNRGRGFSLRRGAPNELRPGARPAHTLVPLLVLRGEAVLAAFGTMGGRAQPLILFQLLPGALAQDRPLEETLAAARWVTGAADVGFETQTVALEEHADGAIAERLGAGRIPVARIPRFDERVGHAQVVRMGAARLESASDPRSDGESGVARVPPRSGLR